MPSGLFEESSVGDWWIVKSLLRMVMEMVELWGETKPRVWEGRGCVKRRNVSSEASMISGPRAERNSERTILDVVMVSELDLWK